MAWTDFSENLVYKITVNSLSFLDGLYGVALIFFLFGIFISAMFILAFLSLYNSGLVNMRKAFVLTLVMAGIPALLIMLTIIVLFNNF